MINSDLQKQKRVVKIQQKFGTLMRVAVLLSKWFTFHSDARQKMKNQAAKGL